MIMQLLGLYEQLHQEDITAAKFTGMTLITASVDCTIGIGPVSVSTDRVDLQPRSFLHGHRWPVTTIAVSRTLSTILSADTSGQVILWDLNTHERIRDIPVNVPVQVRPRPR